MPSACNAPGGSDAATSTGGTPSIAQDDDCSEADCIERRLHGDRYRFNACRNSKDPSTTVARQRRPCLRLPDAIVRTAVPPSTWGPLITGASPSPAFRPTRHPKATALSWAAKSAPVARLPHSGGRRMAGKKWAQRPPKRSAVGLVASRIECTSSGSRSSDFFDGPGFALIALEWFRGYREMGSKVTLVARNLERAEKIRLKREIKDANGSVGVAEVGALYEDVPSPTWPGTPTRSTSSITSERPMPGCYSLASSRSSLALVLQLLGA